MKSNSWFAAAVAVVLCFLGAATSLRAQSDEPSLAEIARQKSAVKARKVVTNDQIPPSPEANNPPAKTNNAGATAKPASAEKDASAKTSTPDTQARIQQLKTDNEGLQKVIAKLQERIDTTEDRNLITTLAEAQQHARRALASNQAELDKLNAAAAPAAPAPATLSSEQPAVLAAQGATK